MGGETLIQIEALFSLLRFGHSQRGGEGVDLNPNTFETSFCLTLVNMNIFSLHFFPHKKVPCRCPRTQGKGGGGQGNSDIVQI